MVYVSLNRGTAGAKLDSSFSTVEATGNGSSQQALT